jgi:protein tyrosine phosphatase (PTP) superfamily phosphohydrolase (DUF442 family)
MHAENTHQVFDWLWASGQLSVQDIQQLPALGIQHAINLAPPNSSNALQGEAEFISGSGINYFQTPITWDNPELEKLQKFMSLLSFLQDQKPGFTARKMCAHPRLFICLENYIWVKQRQSQQYPCNIFGS